MESHYEKLFECEHVLDRNESKSDRIGFCGPWATYDGEVSTGRGPRTAWELPGAMLIIPGCVGSHETRKFEFSDPPDGRCRPPYHGTLIDSMIIMPKTFGEGGYACCVAQSERQGFEA